jgi:succinoglycan biosynthesis transport protein ExoP
MNHTDNQQSINVTEYYHLILRHKWIIIAAVGISLMLASIRNARMTPIYQATATIIIDSGAKKAYLPNDRPFYESYVSQTLTFNTHFQLIKSRPVIEKIIKKLNLDEHLNNEKKEIEEINPIRKFFSQFKINIFLQLGKEKKMPVEEDKLAGLVRSIQGMIGIEPIEDTRLLRINVMSPSPERAKNVANAAAQAYIDFDIDNQMKSSQNTLTWLTDHLYDVTKKLEDAEAEFLAYKQKSELISMEDSQTTTAQKITDFNDAYLIARNKRMELDTKLEQLEIISKSGKGVPNLSSLIQNELINDLHSQVVNAEVELSKIRKIYKSKHPKVVQASTNVSRIRYKLQAELQKEVENLKAERSILMSRENVLQKTITDFKDEAMETGKKELKYTILKRNVDIHQNLYNTLLTRLKEVDITGNIHVSSIRITAKASLPNYPMNINTRRNLMLGLIMGLMIGIGLSFLLEYIDVSIRTEEDVQKYLDLPVLSIIPLTDFSEKNQTKTEQIS